LKCPECENTFGYLLVQNLEKAGKYHEFSCPKCDTRLSSEPLVNFLKKADNYIGISVILSFILIAIAVVFGNGLATNVSAFLIVPVSIYLIYLGLKTHKLCSSVFYKKVS
jgi:hypothetical protein